MFVTLRIYSVCRIKEHAPAIKQNQESLKIYCSRFYFTERSGQLESQTIQCAHIPTSDVKTVYLSFGVKFVYYNSRIIINTCQ